MRELLARHLSRPGEFTRHLERLQNALFAVTMAFAFCLILISLISRMVAQGW